MYDYITTPIEKLQALEFLQDTYTDKAGVKKVRPWREKKLANELLAIAYDEINADKAARLRECGKVLTYNVFADGTKKLARTTSCRVRLCPICTWRRSLVNFATNLQIVNFLEAEKPRGWIFATFTIGRCSGSELSAQIDRILYAYKKLLLQIPVKKAVKGAYRGLEITHDTCEFVTPTMLKKRPNFAEQGLCVGDRNPLFNTYHVHLHCIFCTTSSYFKNSNYLTHDAWVAAWQQALDVDYTPIVDVKRIRPKDGSIAGAVGEVSKYATKSNDYLVPEDWDLTVDTVRLLDSVLNGRRFVSYSGELLRAKRALKLKDADNADLTHITGEYADSPESAEKDVSYFWYTGYRQYCRIKD